MFSCCVWPLMDGRLESANTSATSDMPVSAGSKRVDGVHRGGGAVGSRARVEVHSREKDADGRDFLQADEAACERVVGKALGAGVVHVGAELDGLACRPA